MILFVQITSSDSKKTVEIAVFKTANALRKYLRHNDWDKEWRDSMAEENTTRRDGRMTYRSYHIKENMLEEIDLSRGEEW